MNFYISGLGISAYYKTVLKSKLYISSNLSPIANLLRQALKIQAQRLNLRNV